MNGEVLEVTILVDNEAGEGLVAEHGFSALIAYGGYRVLFDTGAGAAIEPNARAAGASLAQTQAIVLSHGHYDHTGGLPVALAGGSKADLYFHPAVLRTRYSVDGRGRREIGIPARSREAFAAVPRSRLHSVSGKRLLTEHIGIGAPIARRTAFEDTGGPFFLDSSGATPDPIEDDLVLWVRTAAGVVVVVGCCHAGIINTLEQVREWGGDGRVRAVIGGLHLLNAEERRLAATIAGLEVVSPEAIVPCHCTGEAARSAFARAFPGRVSAGRSGRVLRFEG